MSVNTSTARVTILPPGVELPDGTVLAFPAHRRCPCRDCRDAWRAYRLGLLNLPEGVLS